MQVVGVALRAYQSLRAPRSIFPQRCLYLRPPNPGLPSPSPQSRPLRTFPLANASFPGCGNGGSFLSSEGLWKWQNPESSMSFCSSSEASSANSTDYVKELCDKINESIKVKRSAPPNAWLWSLIEKCKSGDDLKLLFDVLQQLRIFRLSNLQIHDNFNCNMCQEVTKACIRVEALNFGKKALWKLNIFGLTPTIGSANRLLSYAKMKKDVKLMGEILSLLKSNNLPLQPATADIVFSICFEADKWELINKYSKRFLKAGVKLRKTTFDTWLEFASKRGDLESLWKIENLRSDTYKQHTVKSAFSCAKGFLLKLKPEKAAAAIQVVNQTFPESKRNDIIAELQKLVSEWPIEVIKHQKQDDQKAIIASLKSDIPTMISALSKVGLELSVNLEDLWNAELM